MLWLTTIWACAAFDRPTYPVITPPEAIVDVSLPTLAALTPADLTLWERYTRGHPGWEVASTRDCLYAVRVVDEAGASNGYIQWRTDGLHQTRVVTAFGCSLSPDRTGGDTVRTSALAGPTQLRLEDYMQQPGDNSLLVVAGGSGLSPGDLRAIRRPNPPVHAPGARYP